MRRKLIDRWKTEAGQALSDEVTARLIVGRTLNDLALDEYEGRVDLRFLPAPTPRRLKRFEAQGWFVEELGDLVTFRQARLENLDLSGAQLHSFRFHASQISGCRFDGTNCQDWRLWATDVINTSFVKASLRNAVVGAWYEGRGNRWSGINFSGADFRVVPPEQATFEDCDFSEAKMAKVRFEQCTLIRCRFAGELREVVFDGRELPDRPASPSMESVDFSDARFQQVEFMGFDLNGLILPNDPDLRVVRRARCVARRGIELLDGDDRVQARMLRAMLETRLRGAGTESEARVFNRRDYLELGGVDLLRLAEDVTTRAETDCLK